MFNLRHLWQICVFRRWHQWHYFQLFKTKKSARISTSRFYLFFIVSPYSAFASGAVSLRSGFGNKIRRDNFHFLVFGSFPTTLNFNTSPSLQTSSILATFSHENSEIWIKPSVPGRISTKQPKSFTAFTFPSYSPPSSTCEGKQSYECVVLQLSYRRHCLTSPVRGLLRFPIPRL